MALSEDILSLLREEGYKVNESVIEALNDFITIVEEETEGMDEDDDEDGFDDD